MQFQRRRELALRQASKQLLGELHSDKERGIQIIRVTNMDQASSLSLTPLPHLTDLPREAVAEPSAEGLQDNARHHEQEDRPRLHRRRAGVSGDVDLILELENRQP